MTERDKLIELLTGKSIDTPIDVKCVTDYLLENGVILSPVKVGDAVYMIQENNIVKLYVNYIEIGINNTDTDIDFYYANKKWEDIDYDNYDEDEDGNKWFNISEINKTVFLTHKDAEKVLSGKD